MVKKGQLLAELDTAKLKDSVNKSRAAVAAAEATVVQKQATVAEARASLARMRHVAELSGGKVPAKTELETAEATLQRAVADEASARADVSQAKATLKTDETNLGKAIIRSPVNGVVLTRKVEPGQTVAAQMTTPVLFVLAEDLSKMELQVKVDEADVGNVRNRPESDLHRLGLAGAQVPGNHPARRPRLDDDRQRGHLQDHSAGRQRRPRLAAGHDGDGQHRHRRTRGTCCWCPTPRCASRRRQRTKRRNAVWSPG